MVRASAPTVTDRGVAVDVCLAPNHPRGLLRLGTLPVAVAVLTLITAAYYLLVALGNITDFNTNQAFVQHVFEMDTTFGDEDMTWRAIGNSAIQNIAYIAIIIWEVLIAAVLIWAVVAWVAALRGRSGYERARRLSTVGWTMVLLLFAGGFIVIGGEWFVMWQSEEWNGLDPALQNVIIAGLALILAHLPSREWDIPVRATAPEATATSPREDQPA